MTTITNTNTNINIANIELSKKFKEANIRFQATWTQWLDDAQSWAIYLNELIDILHYEHPDIQISLIERIAGISTDKAKIEVAQTIRDLETGALFKPGKSYHVHTHLRDKIDENKVEYTPYKNYFEILKHSNELLRFLTGHQFTQGEYEYNKNHINYSAQHRIDIIKSLDSRTIVALIEQLRMLRYAIESMESLVSGEEANQTLE